MFANILPDLAARGRRRAASSQIAVDPRLIPLFQRSFPKAEVGRYDDRTLIDRDGNKSLRFVPFSIDKGEPDYLGADGLAAAISSASASAISRTRRSSCPIRSASPNSAAQLEGFGPGP